MTRPRRRWPLVLGAVAVVLALFVGGTVTWLVTDRMDRDRRDSSAGPTPLGSPTGGADTNAAVKRHEAITGLLEARSEAILARDKPAFLALIDPSSTRFKEQQATVFDRMTKVPFESWEYDFAGEGPSLSGSRAASLPDGSWVARVLQRYVFGGSDSAVERGQFLTLVPAGDGWLLAGDRDGGDEAAGFLQARDIWELGPVNVVRGRTSLVIGEAKVAALRGYAREADRSVRDVDAVWESEWSRRPIILVPRTQADMARVIGVNAKGLDQIAAVTTGYSASGPTQGDRVVVNPAAWRELGDLGQRVVMTHEVTHLATRAVTYGSVPIWMSEGFADYVAYEAVDIPIRVIAEQVLDDVRAGDVPPELPTDIDFDPTSSDDIAPAYEGSWLAAKLIGDRYGEKKLVRLYVTLADRDNETANSTVNTVLGISENRLVRDWKAYLKSLARG